MELISRKPNEPGVVYAFVPAHGESKAGTVARQLSHTLSEGLGGSVLLADFNARGFPLWGTSQAPQRLDGRTWGAFVTPGEAFDTLEAREAHPRELQGLLNQARSLYKVTCADLTESREVASLEVLRQADAVFIVSASDAASLDKAKYRAEWLRSLDLEDHGGLLLHRAAEGCSMSEAEHRTKLRVCSFVDTDEELGRLASWLTPARDPGFAKAKAC